jgi:hypothetical protein
LYIIVQYYCRVCSLGRQSFAGTAMPILQHHQQHNSCL